jgi:hypothetical protein
MKSVLVSAAALLLVMGMIYAVDEPPLKEGLWSVRTQMIQNPGNQKDETTRSICRNHAFDAYALAQRKNTKCKTLSENSSGGTITTVSECTVGTTLIKNTGTVTMSGDTAAHSEGHTTYTPPVKGMSESTIIMDQKYVGACPAGVEPGDTIDADGKIQHTWKR